MYDDEVWTDENVGDSIEKILLMYVFLVYTFMYGFKQGDILIL